MFDDPQDTSEVDILSVLGGGGDDFVNVVGAEQVTPRGNHVDELQQAFMSEVQ